MTTKRYLIILGVGVTLLGLLGVFGVLNQQNTPFYVLDSGEHQAHLVLGLVALAVVFVPGLNTWLAPYHKPVLIVIGALALLLGVFGFLVILAGMPVPNLAGLPNFKNWIDSLLHVVIGGSALWVALKTPARQRA